MKSPHKHPQVKTIVISDGKEFTLDGISLQELSLETQKALKRFVDIVRNTHNTITIRQAKNLIVGRIALGSYIIIVPPPMPPHTFVNFLIYALQGDIRRYHVDDYSGVQVENFRNDLFLQLMAALLVHHSEHILKTHLSKSYVAKELRTSTLKGSVLWAKSFGRHPADGLTCRAFELITDEPMNQLVLAGLEAAARILHGTKYSSLAATQLFVWGQIARRQVPCRNDFERAEQRISRLTEHYRPALTLSRAITFGLSPIDLETTGTASLNHLEFYIPLLFESFLARLLTPYAAMHGLRLSFKASDKRALLDGDGQLYRKIEPDITVLRGRTPVGVIDAKFKPRYLKKKSTYCDEPLAKVTNSDIYQLFFYQARLQFLSHLTSPPRAVIIAPVSIDDTSNMTSLEKRTILWTAGLNPQKEQPSLTVLPAPIETILAQLKHQSEIEVIENYMPEVANEIRTMAINS